MAWGSDRTRDGDGNEPVNRRRNREELGEEKPLRPPQTRRCAQTQGKLLQRGTITRQLKSSVNVNRYVHKFLQRKTQLLASSHQGHFTYENQKIIRTVYALNPELVRNFV
jgi:hypothetical protein